MGYKDYSFTPAAKLVTVTNDNCISCKKRQAFFPHIFHNEKVHIDPLTTQVLIIHQGQDFVSNITTSIMQTTFSTTDRDELRTNYCVH